MRAKKPQAKRPARTDVPDDAVSLLMADHRKVEKLFKKSEKASGREKEALVKQICAELIVHTTLEEDIFYPACREQGVEEDAMDEAQVEHDGAKFLIADLLNQSAASDCYDAKVTVLTEYIKHHVQEEEKPRSGIFAKARAKGLDLDAIGAQLQERKESLMADPEDLPAPTPKTIGLSALAT
jgi:hypothetical protein